MSDSLQGQYAGFLSRTFGFFSDAIFIGLTELAFRWLVSAIVLQVTSFSIGACPALEMLNLKVMTCRAAGWGLAAFLAGFPVVYILFFWILTGQTPGDFAAGVRVVQMDGRRISLASGGARIFGYMVCFLSLGLGYLWILVDDRRQGWHDKLARTCVIYAWEARHNASWIQKLNQRLFYRTHS